MGGDDFHGWVFFFQAKVGWRSVRMLVAFDSELVSGNFSDVNI